MGDFLYVSVTKEHSVIQQEAYWWPLIFEAMHRANFQFPQRGNNERQGVFFLLGKWIKSRVVLRNYGIRYM